MSALRALSRFFLISLFLLATAAHAREMVSVDRPEANMRAGASTRHDILWTLSQGYPLEVISHKGQWLRVRDFENDRGWIYRPLTGKTAHHIVKVKIANIRKGPSTSQRIVAKAQYGELLRTLGRTGDWVRVKLHDGGIGWVAKNLLWGW